MRGERRAEEARALLFYRGRTVAVFSDEAERKERKDPSPLLHAQTVAEQLSALGASVVPLGGDDATRAEFVLLRRSAVEGPARLCAMPSLLALLDSPRATFRVFEGSSLASFREIFPLRQSPAAAAPLFVLVGLDALADDVLMMALELLHDLRDKEPSARIVFAPGTLNLVRSAAERGVPGGRFAERDVEDLRVPDACLRLTEASWADGALHAAQEALCEHRDTHRHFVAVVRRASSEDGGGVRVLDVENGLPRFLASMGQRRPRWSDAEITVMHARMLEARRCRHVVVTPKTFPETGRLRPISIAAIQELIVRSAPSGLESLSHSKGSLFASFRSEKEAASAADVLRNRGELKHASIALDRIDATNPTSCLKIEHVATQHAETVLGEIRRLGGIPRPAPTVSVPLGQSSQDLSEFLVDFAAGANAAIEAAFVLHEKEVEGFHLKMLLDDDNFGAEFF